MKWKEQCVICFALTAPCEVSFFVVNKDELTLSSTQTIRVIRVTLKELYAALDWYFLKFAMVINTLTSPRPAYTFPPPNPFISFCL